MAPWPPDGEPAGKGTKPVTLPRPGHADLAGVQKFGHDDVRNALERASARHTAVHVAAGAVAKALLAEIGITVRGVDRRRGRAARARSTRRGRSATPSAVIVEVRATGVPPGLGSYATKEDRLDARLAAAVMGIQAVKGVEIGDGFALASLRGSEAHDEIDTSRRRTSNRAGGIEAGVSNGEEIVVRAAMKPLPTLMKPLASVDLATRRGGDRARRALRRGGGRGARGRRRGRGRLGARGRREGEVRRRRGRRLRRRASRVLRAHSMALNALDRHIALVGFMGAGKTTIGAQRRGAARPAGRRRRPRDRGAHRDAICGPLRSSRARRVSRRSRRMRRRRCSTARRLPIIALGGGAVDIPRHARPLTGAFTRAPRRGRRDCVGSGSREATAPARRGRGGVPAASYAERQPLYREVADAVVPSGDVDGVVLAAAGIHHELGALERLGELVPGDGPVALVADSTVMGIHGPRAQAGARRPARLDPRAAAGRAGEAGSTWSSGCGRS